MIDSKTWIIAQRRHTQARRRVGMLLEQMEKEKRYDIVGIQNLCSVLRMDRRTLRKILGFRIFPADEKTDFVSIDELDFETIRQAREIAKLYGTLDPDRKKIAQLIFLANV